MGGEMLILKTHAKTENSLSENIAYRWYFKRILLCVPLIQLKMLCHQILHQESCKKTQEYI